MLDDEAANVLRYDWEFWARPSQLPPSWDWDTWLVLAGRGWGKTRTGAEWMNQQAERSGKGGRGALVARTAGDCRDTLIEGKSGILAISPPWFMPTYEPSKRRVTWPNGFVCTAYSAEKPDALRGPEHQVAWCDELAAWKHLQDTLDNLNFGMRIGALPQTIITTTPRPLRVLRDMVKDATAAITRGTTYDNLANLSARFRRAILKRYEGTRTGRQELLAELLAEAEGALWRRDYIQNIHFDPNGLQAEDLVAVVVAIDPQSVKGEKSDLTGITVNGRFSNNHGILLEDLSGNFSPNEWAKTAINAFYRWRPYSVRIVAETNNGGDMVENTIRTIDKNVPFKRIHAHDGKAVRAEPVAALYEQKRITHALRANDAGAMVPYSDLEDELCNWVPGEGMASPNRLDAAVYGFTELFTSVGAGKMQKIKGA